MTLSPSLRWPLAIGAVLLLVSFVLGWVLMRPTVKPELTRAERKHLERQAATLQRAGQSHYSTAQALLHDPIPAGDSTRRLAAFDSTIATW